MLSKEGGADAFADASGMLVALRQVPTDQMVNDGNAAVRFLQNQPYVRNDRVGASWIGGGDCGSSLWNARQLLSVSHGGEPRPGLQYLCRLVGGGLRG